MISPRQIHRYVSVSFVTIENEYFCIWNLTCSFKFFSLGQMLRGRLLFLFCNILGTVPVLTETTDGVIYSILWLIFIDFGTANQELRVPYTLWRWANAPSSSDRGWQKIICWLLNHRALRTQIIIKQLAHYSVIELIPHFKIRLGFLHKCKRNPWKILSLFLEFIPCWLPTGFKKS